jgi:hypothetical protein
VFEGLEPGRFYCARRRDAPNDPLTVVQVTALFGEEPEYWTRALPGSDHHHMPSDFIIYEEAREPQRANEVRHAAEQRCVNRDC